MSDANTPAENDPPVIASGTGGEGQPPPESAMPAAPAPNRVTDPDTAEVMAGDAPSTDVSDPAHPDYTWTGGSHAATMDDLLAVITHVKAWAKREMGGRNG
jgi:hypothetical protein